MADTPDFKFVFFNVGQGDATMISNLVLKKSVLVDVNEAQPVLEEISLHGSSIQAVIISHWDDDHWKGLPSLIDKLKQDNKSFVLYANYKMNGKNATPKDLKRVLELGIEEGIMNIKPIHLGEINEISMIGMVVEILWPSYEELLLKPGNNFTSVIVNLKIKDKRILLLPGDGTGKCWKRIDKSKLMSMIFKFPHHGGSILSSLTAKEVIEKVNPKKVVVSYGKNNKYKHPSKGFQKAKAELSNKIEFYDTTVEHITIYYDSKENVLS